MIHYSYSKTEINKILKTLVIVADTREQKNEHVLKYLRAKKVPYVVETLKTGDYACKIPRNDELGITRDIYLAARIERKAHIDEITGNLQKATRSAFENELIRSKDIPFTLICEDKDGYEKMIKGDYRSDYEPLALLGTLNSFKAKYDFEIVYLDPKCTGNFIYYHFYYQAMHWLKQGVI